MRILKLVIMLFICIQSTIGQELAFESVKIDKDIYDISDIVEVIPSPVKPTIFSGLNVGWYVAYFNKKTSQYDIFIQYSKTASVNIPNMLQNKILYPQFISQKIFNTNDDWEILWQYADSEQATYNHTILTSSDGTIIWESLPDEKGGYVYFDGIYTYIHVSITIGTEVTQRYYRFHPTLSSENSSLSKKTSTASTLLPIFSFSPEGNYTLKLSRSAGGATTVSLLNLLGRQIFSKTIPDLNKDITISLPSGTVNSGPVIAKIRNSEGTSYTKSVPVR